MAWNIRFGDTRVSIEDLPIEKFVPIAKRHDVSWYELLATPGAHPQAFYEVVCLAADQAGIPHPEKPSKMGEIVGLLEMLEVGQDDLPTEWSEGNPQGAGQETT